MRKEVKRTTPTEKKKKKGYFLAPFQVVPQPKKAILPLPHFLGRGVTFFVPSTQLGRWLGI